MIEITGAQGKTTTAHALAHILPGKGVLHTSTGTYAYPTKDLLGKKSITPASGSAAVRYANQMPGWLVAEISLGVTGAGRSCHHHLIGRLHRLPAGRSAQSRRRSLRHDMQNVFLLQTGCFVIMKMSFMLRILPSAMV